MEKVKRLSVGLLPYRLATMQTLLVLLCTFFVFIAQASAVVRFNHRSMLIEDVTPGAAVTYIFSFTYNNLNVASTTVGSIDIEFCYDPIPGETVTLQNPVDHHPCVVPTGLDVSQAVLSDQTGETGFSILSQTPNHIILTRTPGAVSETPSTYTFTGIVNPTDDSRSFAARLSDYSSTDATGQVLNLGSVVSRVGQGVLLETQVPPMMIFCLGHTVELNCTGTDGGNYSDMGTLDPNAPLTATSQMAAGTNATGGYVITANGPTMEAGTNIVNPLAAPTISAPGNNQFGMNLVANSSPGVGNDPDGPFANAAPAPDYAIPDQFTYRDGDAVASAPNVSLMRRFTVSYLLNSAPNIRPGVYTTTITFICTGRF